MPWDCHVRLDDQWARVDDWIPAHHAGVRPWSRGRRPRYSPRMIFDLHVDQARPDVTRRVVPCCELSPQNTSC
jgi:hypothetical protein